MGTQDERVSDYIAKSAPFAQPILERIREAVHTACPEAAETMKWNSPTFMYHGSNMVGMAAFKQHCRLIFWQADAIEAPGGERPNAERIGRLASVADLPSKKLFASFIKQSMQAIDAGVKLKRAPAGTAGIALPDDLRAALKQRRGALERFEAASPSHRREYIEWITEARRAETRARRIARAAEWIAEGKPRNWKYM